MAAQPLFSPLSSDDRRKGRGPILHHGVTAKEEAFCQAVVVHSMNNSDAFRASHCAAAMAPATVWRKASLVANRGRVRARVAALRAEIDRRTYDDAEDIRRLVLDRLLTEAETARHDGARVRALELLGKTIGMFRDRREVEMRPFRSAAEIEADLCSRLRELLPQL